MIRAEDVLRILNNNSKLFSLLYEKRDKEVLLSDILTDDLSLDTLYRFEKRFELLDVSRSHVSLSEIFINFLDEVLGVPTEIRIGALNDLLEGLEKNIDDYQDEKITSKGKIAKSIKRNLKRIRTAMVKTLEHTQERVIIEFKSQSDNYKKRKELEHYRKKIIEFKEMRETISRKLELESDFFASIGSQEVKVQYIELKKTLHNLGGALAKLQLDVTAHILKLAGDNEEVKKIIEIAEMIRGQEFREYTNIRTLLEQRGFRLAALDREGTKTSKKIKVSVDEEVEMQGEYINAITSLPEDLFNIEARLEAFNEKTPEYIPEPIDDECMSEESIASDTVDIASLFLAFSGSDTDLFTFISGSEIGQKLTLFEKIMLYKMTLASNESKLVISDENLIVSKVKISKIYLK